MGILILFTLIVLLLFGASFAFDFLLWVALFAALLWVVGFLMRGAERTWYRW
jgi:hypothetical protein